MPLKVWTTAILKNVPSDNISGAKNGDVVVISGGLEKRAIRINGKTYEAECYTVTMDGSSHWAAMPWELTPTEKEAVCSWQTIPFWHQILGPRKAKPS